MDELIVAYYQAKGSQRETELASIWARLDDVSRVIAEPLIEIPRGITEGRIRVVDSNASGDTSMAQLSVDVIIEGQRGSRTMRFALDVPWSMLDNLEPRVYAEAARAFGFQSRPQTAPS